MQKTKITHNIDYLEPDSYTNFTACSGIIVNGSPKILIDTNMGLAETPDLIKTERPDISVISHYHLDHSIWSQFVLKHSMSKLFIPFGERKYFTDRASWIENSGLSGELKSLWLYFMNDITKYKELQDYSTYDHNDRFETNDTHIQVISTPGHSPFHNSFHFPNERILFTGDIGIDRFGPWYGSTDCNLYDFIGSIIKLKSLDIDLLLTSHGGIIKENIQDAFTNLFKTFIDREEKIALSLDKGLSKMEIVKEGIYYNIKKQKIKEPMSSFFILWDGIMFDHHKDVLDKGGIKKFI